MLIEFSFACSHGHLTETPLHYLPETFRTWALETLSRKFPTDPPERRFRQLRHYLRQWRKCRLGGLDKTVMYQSLSEDEAASYDTLMGKILAKDD